MGLPGVGRKTAACVLLFALGKREVPVDTHVSRVGIRLGLLPAGAPFEVLHDRMLALTPRGASSSCTSTCCATAGAPATPAAPCELRLEPMCPSSAARRAPRASARGSARRFRSAPRQTAKAMTAYCRAAAATTRAWKTSW